MVLGVNDFKAKLKGGGARPNLFKVTLNFPSYANGDVELTSFMCKGANLPASTMEPIPVPFRGRQLQVAGQRTFEPWTVTIINDTDFNVRNALERWSNGINAHTANTGLVNPADYQVDLIVDQLDRDETVIKQYKFISAFPTRISEIDLNYETTGVVEEFTVDFSYQWWESDTTS